VISIGGLLRRQLLIGLLFALAASGIGVWWIVRRALIAQHDGALLAKARLFATVIKEEPGEGMVLDLDETPMPEFERPDNPEYFEVWLPDGKVMARSRSLREGHLAHPSAGTTPSFWNLTLADGRPGRAVTLTAPVRWEDEGGRDHRPRQERQVPVVGLAVARERASLDAALADASWAQALGSLLLLLGVPLLVERAVRRGLRPLDQLAGQAARIDARSLGLRFAVDRVPAELSAICGRLNDLLERLEDSFVRERRFAADVAHELRTPIAELRSIAEVALRYPEPSAPSPRTLEDVLGAAVHMEALVTALLTLSRCESGRQPVSIEAVDLGRLCHDAWPAHQRVARDKGVSTGPGTGPEVVADADPVLLGSVVANLFSNAVEYTPPGGQIAWRTERQGDAAVLVVTNSNATLQADDLPHVFERFWRKDAARTASAHGGLGLSVAEAFVRLLRGELHLDLPRPDLVRVELRLPARGAYSPDGHVSVMCAS
jgi:signal transduction histidine kinase